MVIVNPSVELIDLNQSNVDIVAKAASLCYATENYNPERLYNTLINNKHTSMLRHGSVYYMVPKQSEGGMIFYHYVCNSNIFGKNPYFSYTDDMNMYYISTNVQFIYEHHAFAEIFYKYEVHVDTFDRIPCARKLIRYSFILTTSIMVSRELNRVSPNVIAEQSTRYVNMIKKGVKDVAICKSVLMDELTAVDKAIVIESLSNSAETYKGLIESGVKPEVARLVLTLDTATKVCYTYNISEWKNIINLRVHEITGRAAPDAKYIIGMVRDKLNELGYDL